MTIRDLAKLSGYSLGTVSRALNHQPNVSPKARERILALAQQYGFEINANAQNLKKQNSDSLLVIVKGSANELFARMVEVTQALAAQEQCPLLVDYIDEEENEVRRAMKLSRERKPLGILFFGGTAQNFLSDYMHLSLPTVLVTNSAKGLPFGGLSSVTTDDIAASRTVCAFLVNSGHRRIAVIGGDLEVSEISRNRLEGCRRALAEAGLEVAAYRAARFSFEGGYRAMEKLLAHRKGITAVFAMADVMALGAMRCIHDHGLRVPEDISVAGFDGLPYGQYSIPRLTTVAQSAQALAETGYRVLREQIATGKTCHVCVPFSLIPGSSVCTLPSLGSPDGGAGRPVRAD